MSSGDYIVVYVNAALYGLHMVVASMTLYFVNKGIKDTSNFKRSFMFVRALIGLATLNFGLFTSHIVYGYNPGRDLNISVLYATLWATEITAMAITALSHSLLIYRFHVIWNRPKVGLIILIVVLVMILVLGIISMFAVVNPSLFALHSFMTAPLIYAPPLVGFNLTITLLICGRIIWCQRAISKLSGAELGQGGRFNHAIIIVVESCLVYTIAAVACIILSMSRLGSYNADFRLIFSVLTQVECIASELVILQVARGQTATREWASKAAESAARFERPNQTRPLLSA